MTDAPASNEKLFAELRRVAEANGYVKASNRVAHLAMRFADRIERDDAFAAPFGELVATFFRGFAREVLKEADERTKGVI